MMHSRVEEIRRQFRDNEIGFHFALQTLMTWGFTEFAAEEFLYAQG